MTVMTPELSGLSSPRDVAGVAARTSNAREADPTTAMLPALWARFAATLPQGTVAPVYAVQTEYESDVDGAYTTVVGYAAGVGTEAAERVVHVSAGRYAIFRCAGAMPAAVIAGWQAVWEYFAKPEAPARTYVADFEYYHPATPSVVRIFVGIRDGNGDAAGEDEGRTKRASTR